MDHQKARIQKELERILKIYTHACKFDGGTYTVNVKRPQRKTDPPPFASTERIQFKESHMASNFF